ncbi:hypothetical protein E2C01_011019 [Portunus trituberculatus]|uniref:Uncharacterized protein n=1 Tax=Portunus trituberculatus TaxID=210409 RepID=A0A5B7DAA1_PORTR|nr:hypothetical protein [Portunus trituberculatus]
MQLARPDEQISLSHVAFPSMMSSVICRPDLNSSTITARVDCEVLKVEFCWGYAGVMIGIK